MATGFVKIHNESGKSTLVRAIFDTGAESNLILDKCVLGANLRKENFVVEIEGIIGKQIIKSGIVHAKISPWFNQSDENSLSRSFIVMNKLPLTQRNTITERIPEFNEILKADPYFNERSQAQILLGVDFWANIIKDNVIRSNTGLVAQETSFGFVIFGAIKSKDAFNINSVKSSICKNEMIKLDSLLQKFWEIEEQQERSISEEDDIAEQYYVRTVSRDDTGRYVVRIPFNDANNKLGNSKGIALTRFMKLERRLNIHHELKEKYHEFMREYIDLNHMSEFKESENDKNGFFIPHHPVVKRFRVVFDGSCASNNGNSINDMQFAGPNLQEDLVDIIMRFAMYCANYQCLSRS